LPNPTLIPELSTAYETLMNPSSRMSYDLGGASMGAQNVNADEVLDEVLRKIYEVGTMALPDS
jgi:curved DNA-binding protein CbpA